MFFKNKVGKKIFSAIKAKKFLKKALPEKSSR
jgi:hypothetical protein